MKIKAPFKIGKGFHGAPFSSRILELYSLNGRCYRLTHVIENLIHMSVMASAAIHITCIRGRDHE